MELKSPRRTLRDLLLGYASGLRFPKLFVLTAAVFLIDTIFPDVLPFADEILLGLIAVLLGSWRKRHGDRGSLPETPDTGASRR